MSTCSSFLITQEQLLKLISRDFLATNKIEIMPASLIIPSQGLKISSLP